jgi:hypothetical protein
MTLISDLIRKLNATSLSIHWVGLLLFMGAANGAFASICPGEVPGAPQLPAITKVEIFNPAAPSKPFPAIGQDRANGRRSLIGGSVDDGKLDLLFKLSQPIPAGCKIRIEIYDQSASPTQLSSGFGYTIANEVIPAVTESRFFSERDGTADGTNSFRISLSLIGRVKNAKLYTFKARLIAVAGGPNSAEFRPSQPVLFSFENKPFEIGSYTVDSNEVPAGERAEIITTVNAMPTADAKIQLSYLSSNRDAGGFVSNSGSTNAEMSGGVIDGIVNGKPTARIVFLAKKPPTNRPKNTRVIDDSTILTVNLKDSLNNVSDARSVSVIAKNCKLVAAQ